MERFITQNKESMFQKIILWFLVVTFSGFAVVQYNDPDPYVWIPTYLIASVLCYYRLQGNGEKIMYFSIGLLFLMWGINQFPPAWEGVLLNGGMKIIPSSMSA